MPGAADRRIAAAVAQRCRHPRRARAHAGSTPKSNPVSIDTRAVNASAAPSMPISSSRGMPAGPIDDQRANARVREQHARRAAHEREQLRSRRASVEPAGSGRTRAPCAPRSPGADLPLARAAGSRRCCTQSAGRIRRSRTRSAAARATSPTIRSRSGRTTAPPSKTSVEPARTIAHLTEARDQAPSVLGRGFDRDARRESRDRRDEVCCRSSALAGSS